MYPVNNRTTSLLLVNLLLVAAAGCTKELESHSSTKQTQISDKDPWRAHIDLASQQKLEEIQGTWILAPDEMFFVYGVAHIQGNHVFYSFQEQSYDPHTVYPQYSASSHVQKIEEGQFFIGKNDTIGRQYGLYERDGHQVLHIEIRGHDLYLKELRLIRHATQQTTTEPPA